MIGFLYFLLTLVCGSAVSLLVAPSFGHVRSARPLLQGRYTPKAWSVWLPASFIFGVMISAWSACIGAYAFADSGHPMLWGAVCSAALCLVFVVLAACICRTRIQTMVRELRQKGFKALLLENRAELLFLLAVAVFWSVLIIRSFYYADGDLKVGFSVYSDFCPHLGVIRSFSEGSNIPVQYPHFADGTIRYHFMFQFAVGMLEYLGMRLDIAFNLLSLCSILAMMQLLRALTLQVTGSRAVAHLTALFFTFRSSFAVFTYFLGAEEGVGSALAALFTSTEHIGNTQSESWGLWTQKVYLNQRHLPLGFAVAFFGIICFYPLLVRMVDDLRAARSKKKNAGGRMRVFALSRSAWLPGNAVFPVVMGLLLGMLGFFNGAVLISVLAVLFFMAMLSRERLSYLVAAVIAVALVLLESRFFIPTGSAAVSPRLTIGFLAESAAFSDIVAYLVELLGVLPFVIVVFVPLMPKGLRWLTLCFTAPVLVAEMLQLTPDITVNHKYIMFGCALLDIVAAAALVRLFSKKTVLLRIVSVALVILMTLTGFADLITQWSLDRNAVRLDEDAPLKTFIEENTGAGAVFLTDTTYALGDILMAGRMLYCGWSYFAWSAGYDTYGRTQKTAEIYGAADAETLLALLREENIDYVLVDDTNRTSEDYVLNESLIADTLREVYADASAKTFVYAVDPS
ncbi:MAG: hypothetical protein IJC53_02755 [Clostridia bacterium]|nr:hypothetical protein [Clostridia bacterium]